MNDVLTEELTKPKIAQEGEWKAKEKELKDGQIGWIELGGSDSGRFGLINVRDRFGGRLWLPCDLSEKSQPDLEDKLKKLGYNQKEEFWVKMDLDARTRSQLFNANAFLPPLLAIHAVMNHEQGDYYFPAIDDVQKLPAPLVGLEAKPHSGKTLGMLMSVITNQGLVNGFDFDPFSGQSFNHCVKSVLEKLEEKKLNPKECGSHEMLWIIGDVYEKEKSEAVLKAKSDINLRWLLDNAIEVQLNEINPNKMIASLVDLPGEDERTKNWDVMHLVKHIIPTIDMTRKKYITKEIREDYEDITKVPILTPEGFQHHEIFVIFDKIRSELGGYARYHTPPPEEKAWARAIKHQLNFMDALIRMR